MVAAMRASAFAASRSSIDLCHSDSPKKGMRKMSP